MTKPAYFAVGLMSLALPAVLAMAPVQPHYVFTSECFTVTQTERTTLEAPMKDKQPDIDSAVLRHIKLSYKPDCGRLEIR